MTPRPASDTMRSESPAAGVAKHESTRAPESPSHTQGDKRVQSTNKALAASPVCHDAQVLMGVGMSRLVVSATLNHVSNGPSRASVAALLWAGVPGETEHGPHLAHERAVGTRSLIHN